MLRANQREIEDELKKRKEKGESSISEPIKACIDRLRLMIEDLTMPSSID